MRHRLKWLIHLRVQSLSKEDEHPPTLLMGYGTLLYGRVAIFHVILPESVTRLHPSLANTVAVFKRLQKITNSTLNYQNV